MGLLPATISTVSITTSPTNIDSTGYYYHHITVFITSTIGVSDIYTIDVYIYNPVAGTWVWRETDQIDFTSSESNTKKAWEINPHPGNGLRVVLTKVAGANGTADYEIVKAA